MVRVVRQTAAALSIVTELDIGAESVGFPNCDAERNWELSPFVDLSLVIKFPNTTVVGRG